MRIIYKKHYSCLQKNEVKTFVTPAMFRVGTSTFLRSSEEESGKPAVE
jgi:hypothetical protein